MPALGYKKQFAPLVESGEKRQTIRAKRKRPFKVGDRLYHYYGLRTKQCRKLREDDCIQADDILIDEQCRIFINGIRQISGTYEYFAHADGFRKDAAEGAYAKMIRFFRETHGLPFWGQLVRW